jgi:hypothetical protein
MRAACSRLSIRWCATARLGPTVVAPWFAMMNASWAAAKGANASAAAAVPGVAYGTIATAPIWQMSSGSTRSGTGTPANAERGRGRRVGVHDRGDVGARAVERQVHRELRRRTAGPAHRAVEVELHEVVGLDLDLRHPRRRHHDPVARQPRRDVAVRSGNEPALVEPPAHADDVSAQLGRGGGGGHGAAI